jgi:putative transposase
VLEVAPSAYYAWRSRGPGPRALADARLAQRIKELHAASRSTYGSPRLHRLLRAEGWSCSLHRTERLMREHGLRGCCPRRFVTTTLTGGAYQAADNRLARRFAPGGVNALVADITALPTQAGWCYLAVVLSLRSRCVLGWSLSERLHSTAALDALRQALARRPQAPGTLHHSDRGVQYVSHAYQALLRQHGLVPSMSRPANCWDNAVAESFFATLKRELSQRSTPPSRQAVQALVADWIEGFYNPVRLHSALGYRAPADCEKLTL